MRQAVKNHATRQAQVGCWQGRISGLLSQQTNLHIMKLDQNQPLQFARPALEDGMHVILHAQLGHEAPRRSSYATWLCLPMPTCGQLYSFPQSFMGMSDTVAVGRQSTE